VRHDVCANVSVGDTSDVMRCIAAIPSSRLRKKMAGWPDAFRHSAGWGPVASNRWARPAPRGGVTSCREQQLALRGDPQSVLAPGMLDHNLAITLKQGSARDAA